MLPKTLDGQWPLCKEQGMLITPYYANARECPAPKQRIDRRLRAKRGHLWMDAAGGLHGSADGQSRRWAVMRGFREWGK